MFTALLILQVVMALSIIGLVLLQQGKGADMGAAFGAGASGTVFGARGGGSFFTRATAIIATGFFVNSILLSSPLVRDVQDPGASVTQSVTVIEESDVPAVEEEAEAEAIDLPPADLPEVSEQVEETAADVPDMPEPTADTAAESSEAAPETADPSDEAGETGVKAAE